MLLRLSVASALKYHVPSASEVGWVKLLVAEVEVEQLVVNPESEHHCTLYGVAANPEPASVEAVHVQVGVLSFVGVVVDGVPGTVGAKVSPV